MLIFTEHCSHLGNTEVGCAIGLMFCRVDSEEVNWSGIPLKYGWHCMQIAKSWVLLLKSSVAVDSKASQPYLFKGLKTMQAYPEIVIVRHYYLCFSYRSPSVLPAFGCIHFSRTTVHSSPAQIRTFPTTNGAILINATCGEMSIVKSR